MALTLLLCCLAAQPAKAQPGFGALAVNLSELADAMRRDNAAPPTRAGIVLAEVTAGGPADVAGLKPFDLLTKIGDVDVRTQQDFIAAVDALQISQPARVWYRRRIVDGRRVRWDAQQTTVTPIPMPDLERLRKEACPLEIGDAALVKNRFGTPLVAVELRNRTAKTIVACIVDVDCWDNFEDPDRDIPGGTNVFRGISQAKIPPLSSETFRWELLLHEHTTKARIRVVRVKIDGLPEWQAQSGKSPAIRVEIK